MPDVNAGTNTSEPVSSDHLKYTHFGSIENQSDPPASTAVIFKRNHKNILLGKDLGVSPHLRGTLEHVIKRAGGNLVDTVEEAQVYIGAWREKHDYVQVFSF
jgi:hypothetical protein